MGEIKYSPKDKVLKYQKVIDLIINEIEIGKLKGNARLPSINELSAQYSLSRVTVERAYMHLKKRGYISQIDGKGFYVEDKEQKLKVLLIFNKLCYYKRMVYYGLLEVLKDNASIDLQIHHYNVKILDDIIVENLGKYNFYVIMPHFHQDTPPEEYIRVFEKIPPQSLLLLDKSLPDLKMAYMSVYQNFEEDIYLALESVNDLLDKYQRITIIFPMSRDHPLETISGARKYCSLHHKKFNVIESIDNLSPGTAYIAIEEEELGLLIKEIRKTKYSIGKDIGIISFNETILKELLDITVFTTDFTEMGRIGAKLLLSSTIRNVKNAFTVIRRKSL